MGVASTASASVVRHQWMSIEDLCIELGIAASTAYKAAGAGLGGGERVVVGCRPRGALPALLEAAQRQHPDPPRLVRRVG